MAFGETKLTGVWVAPAVPDGTVVGLIASVWQAMTRVYVAPVPMQPFASVALTVIGNVPMTRGVPERVPFAARLSPAGRTPEARLNATGTAPPAWAKVWLNAVFAGSVVTPGFVPLFPLVIAGS